MCAAATYPDASGRVEEGGLSREQWGATAPSTPWLRQVTAGWRSVFLLAVCVDGVGVVLYGALASGERQHWAPRTPGGVVDE